MALWVVGYKSEDMPQGRIIVETPDKNKDVVHKEDFIKKAVILRYISEAELFMLQ